MQLRATALVLGLTLAVLAAHSRLQRRPRENPSESAGSARDVVRQAQQVQLRFATD